MKLRNLIWIFASRRWELELLTLTICGRRSALPPVVQCLASVLAIHAISAPVTILFANCSIAGYARTNPTVLAIQRSNTTIADSLSLIGRLAKGLTCKLVGPLAVFRLVVIRREP